MSDDEDKNVVQFPRVPATTRMNEKAADSLDEFAERLRGETDVGSYMVFVQFEDGRSTTMFACKDELSLLGGLELSKSEFIEQIKERHGR